MAGGPAQGAKAPRPKSAPLKLKGEPDPPLLAALKAWRLERARAASLPAYVIFSDKTLSAIAERRPAEPHQLLALPGVGPMKLTTYGSEVLEIVRLTPAADTTSIPGSRRPAPGATVLTCVVRGIHPQDSTRRA